MGSKKDISKMRGSSKLEKEQKQSVRQKDANAGIVVEWV